MRYAKQTSSEMAEAKPGEAAVCYGCGESVFAKCGPILGWHWCHRSGSECVHAKTEPETKWHSDWKCEVPPAFREVTVRKNGRTKRADIKAKTSTVIELQHSEISRGELADREDFYGRNMFWIFDSDGRKRYINHSSLGNTMAWNGERQYEISMPERVIGVGAASRPSLVDLGDYIARVVPHVSNTGQRFQCVVMPSERIRHAVKATCYERDAAVDWFLLDTASDWMKSGVKSRQRTGQILKGSAVREFCPHVGDLKRYHIQWLAEKTERTSDDYYSDGF